VQLKQVARQRRLQRHWAAPSPTSAASATGPSDPLEDLHREVEVMQMLNHPNLVKLYEVIDDTESGKVRFVLGFFPHFSGFF
jgi:serine/threonine protein kinase